MTAQKLETWWRIGDCTFRNRCERNPGLGDHSLDLRIPRGPRSSEEVQSKSMSSMYAFRCTPHVRRVLIGIVHEWFPSLLPKGPLRDAHPDDANTDSDRPVRPSKSLLCPSLGPVSGAPLQPKSARRNLAFALTSPSRTLLTGAVLSSPSRCYKERAESLSELPRRPRSPFPPSTRQAPCPSSSAQQPTRSKPSRP